MIDHASGNDRAGQPREIRKRAMDLLARREHAPAELAAKLRKRGYTDDDIMPVLDGLIADDLLSATRYARAAVTAKADRGIGPMRIRAELNSAGVDDAIAEDALTAAEVDWYAQAAAVRYKRFGAPRPHDYAIKAKQMRFLQQRGFTGEHIRYALDD